MATLIAGCATPTTFRSYSGDPRPRSQVAFVRTRIIAGKIHSPEAMQHPEVILVKVDGERVPWPGIRCTTDPLTYEILPGEHTLTLAANFDCYTFTVGRTIEQRVTLDPGGTYDLLGDRVPLPGNPIPMLEVSVRKAP